MDAILNTLETHKQEMPDAVYMKLMDDLRKAHDQQNETKYVEVTYAEPVVDARVDNVCIRVVMRRRIVKYRQTNSDSTNWINETEFVHGSSWCSTSRAIKPNSLEVGSRITINAELACQCEPHYTVIAVDGDEPEHFTLCYHTYAILIGVKML